MLIDPKNRSTLVMKGKSLVARTGNQGGYQMGQEKALGDQRTVLHIDCSGSYITS